MGEGSNPPEADPKKESSDDEWAQLKEGGSSEQANLSSDSFVFSLEIINTINKPADEIKLDKTALGQFTALQ